MYVMKVKLKITLTTWIAIYPTITLVLYFFEPYLNKLWLPYKTFILTIIIVPFMTLIAVPYIKTVIKRIQK